MNKYRLFRSKIVQQMPDKTVVDPVLMCMIEHHAKTVEDAAAIRAFCTEPGFRLRHLQILLENIGNRTPFLGLNISVNTWEENRMATCSMKVSQDVFWADNLLKCNNCMLPETLLGTMRGRGLGELIDHPYLPKDLVIAKVTQGKTHLVVSFDVNAKPRMAKS